MTQQIADCTAFLKEAGEALAEVKNLRAEEDRLKGEERKAEEALESARSKLKSDIDAAQKKRLQELTREQDGRLSAAKEELKRAQSAKETARNAGIEERVRTETAPILEESRTKLQEMKDAFRKQHIPWYCTTRLYYRMHYPHKLTDFLTLLVFILVCFGAIPCGIYFLVLPEKFRLPVVLVGIYAASILIFGGIYTFIGNSTMRKYGDMLKMGKETWDEVENLRKQVKIKTREIRRDRSDESYNLGAYDEEIAKAQQKLESTAAERQEALQQFDAVTRNAISDELTEKAGGKIGELLGVHDELFRKLEEVSGQLKEKDAALTENYEAYLGREFMDEEKIGALSEILEKGAAANLTEAMAEYRTGRNKAE